MGAGALNPYTSTFAGRDVSLIGPPSSEGVSSVMLGTDNLSLPGMATPESMWGEDEPGNGKTHSQGGPGKWPWVDLHLKGMSC